MKLEFLDNFKDPYLATTEGRGVFLSGVVLGMLAQAQTPPGGTVDAAPIYKQLNFGRMRRRDLRTHMSRITTLIDVYVKDPNPGKEADSDDADAKDTFKIKDYAAFAQMLKSLAGLSVEMLLSCGERDLGVDGNFTFSVAFLNAPNYFWKIFKKN
ncbi:TM1802 family CRISPR-associated protein [Cloacibacillus evryensis]|mgnify:FL=1|uniref:TM1802 family CRISPR-associated protein n=1 Tax=Cloacibacillus evryensis TaxID=508460 RepID=UPI0022DEF2A3|nr:TM1802 family CRISPR-associated protein [Cloacibacillus evryensis]